MSQKFIDTESPEFIARESEVVKYNEKVLEFTHSLHEEREANRKKFLGKVLTVIDATVTDTNRLKAIKDLVHEAFKNFEEREYQVNGFVFNRLVAALVPEEHQILESDGPMSPNDPRVNFLPGLK